MEPTIKEDRLIKMLSFRNRMGETFFHEVCQCNWLCLLNRVAQALDTEIPEILAIKDYKGEQCIHTIVNCDEIYDKEMMEIIVDLGADINGQEGRGGLTPLHLCVQKKKYKLAKWLCEKRKTNLEAKTYAGMTAYSMAYEKKDEKMMEILKNAGAKCVSLCKEDSDYSE